MITNQNQRSEIKTYQKPLMTFFKKLTSLISWLHFLGLVTSLIKKWSLLLPFFLDECKGFLEINLIKE